MRTPGSDTVVLDTGVPRCKGRETCWKGPASRRTWHLARDARRELRQSWPDGPNLAWCGVPGSIRSRKLTKYRSRVDTVRTGRRSLMDADDVLRARMQPALNTVR